MRTIAESEGNRIPGGFVGDEVGDGETALEHAVAVLDPTASKGLEVDVVVVVDPASIRAAGGPFGAGDVFVAMTRPTRALVVVEAATAGGAG